MEKLPHNHTELQKHHSQPPAEATAAETGDRAGNSPRGSTGPALTRGAAAGAKPAHSLSPRAPGFGAPCSCPGKSQGKRWPFLGCPERPGVRVGRWRWPLWGRGGRPHRQWTHGRASFLSGQTRQGSLSPAGGPGRGREALHMLARAASCLLRGEAMPFCFLSEGKPPRQRLAVGAPRGMHPGNPPPQAPRRGCCRLGPRPRDHVATFPWQSHLRGRRPRTWGRSSLPARGRPPVPDLSLGPEPGPCRSRRPNPGFKRVGEGAGEGCRG